MGSVLGEQEKAQEQQQEWELPAGSSAFDDPLLDCLVLMSKQLGLPQSAEALRAGLPLVDDKLTPDLLVRSAKRAGFSARIVKRRIHKISNLVLPAILLLSEQRACVLLECDKRTGIARILVPESGNGEQEVKLDELVEDYTGYAIFIQSEYRFDERTPEVLNLRSRNWFWGTIFRSWRIYRDVLIASFLINVFALASPLFIMNVYDRVVPNDAIETLWILAIGIATVYGFDFLMRSLRGYFVDVAGKKAEIVLSANIFQHVLGLKSAARPASVGAFASNLREFESIRDFITSATILTLIDLPFLFLFLVIIWIIGGPVVLAPALALPLVLFYGLVVQAPMRRAVEQTFRASSQKNATLVEGLSGVETIKFLGAEGVLQRKWEAATAQIAKWGVRSRLLASSAMNVAVGMQQLTSVAVVVLGVYQISEGSLSMGGLIACVILSGRAMAPMGQVAGLTTRFYQAKSALTSLNEIMKLPVDRPEGKSFLSRPELKGDIEFDNVSFSYPGHDVEVLKGVSFRIKDGERVGIIGRIGSGKTTIEKLILGNYEPDAGSIRVDGTDIRQIDPADLRRNIAYIPQDITLFFGSVRDNITLGMPHADDADILRAAKIAGVDSFVDRHPMGFDMPVGERGELLSGGQRQSIAIARAMLVNPSIMLMDEPTNSMDNTAEMALKSKMAGLVEGKTLVLVTHRMPLLDLVTRLIVLDQGKVIADGPKEQVIEALQERRLQVSK